MNIFSRYSPAIQRYIYSEGWSKLRAIQAAAGDAIFNSDANVLLSASTASGKTEAAFSPSSRSCRRIRLPQWAVST